MTMKSNACMLVACAVLLPFAANANGATLIVAERGKAAEYSIAIPTKASPAQKHAAEELRDFT